MCPKKKRNCSIDRVVIIQFLKLHSKPFSLDKPTGQWFAYFELFVCSYLFSIPICQILLMDSFNKHLYSISSSINILSITLMIFITDILVISYYRLFLVKHLMPVPKNHNNYNSWLSKYYLWKCIIIVLVKFNSKNNPSNKNSVAIISNINIIFFLLLLS